MNRAAHPLPKISGRALGVFISWLLSFTIRASGDIQPVSLAYKVLVRVVTILGSLASVEWLVTTAHLCWRVMKQPRIHCGMQSIFIKIIQSPFSLFFFFNNLDSIWKCRCPAAQVLCFNWANRSGKSGQIQKHSGTAVCNHCRNYVSSLKSIPIPVFKFVQHSSQTIQRIFTNRFVKYSCKAKVLGHCSSREGNIRSLAQMHLLLQWC